MLEYLHASEGRKEQTLFNLRGPFNSLSDVVDKGPLGVAIQRFGTIGVGTDEDGSYISIPSSNSHYLVFGGSMFNGPDVVIELGVKFMDNTNSLVYDTRPPNTNGNYSFLQVWNQRYVLRTPPTNVVTNGVNNHSFSPLSYRIYRRIRLEYLSTGTNLYSDGALTVKVSSVFNHINQVYRVGYHSFNAGAQALRLYYFRVKRIIG